MKINELRSNLELLEKRHGNLEVVVVMVSEEPYLAGLRSRIEKRVGDINFLATGKQKNLGVVRLVATKR